MDLFNKGVSSYQRAFFFLFFLLSIADQRKKINAPNSASSSLSGVHINFVIAFFLGRQDFQFSVSCHMNAIPINVNIYAHIFSAPVWLLILKLRWKQLPQTYSTDVSRSVNINACKHINRQIQRTRRAESEGHFLCVPGC